MEVQIQVQAVDIEQQHWFRFSPSLRWEKINVFVLNVQGTLRICSLMQVAITLDLNGFWFLGITG